MAIELIGAIGAGTMGSGIAQVFARAGYKVIMCDVEQRFLERALANIGKSFDREIAKGKSDESHKTETLRRIETTVDRSRVGGCDFVIEAASEKLETKSELFRYLDRMCRPEV